MDEELKKILDYIEKNHPKYEIKFVISWTELCGNVDSVLFDTYNDALHCHPNYTEILPVIREKRD
jgi:hypothetical protein